MVDDPLQLLGVGVGPAVGRCDLRPPGDVLGGVVVSEARRWVELEDLIRRAVVVDDPVRLLDENLRPAEAVVA